MLMSVTIAGLAAGVTEAVAVVTPMEVIKIRLQAQHHSMADPLDIPKYRNAAHALYTVLKEEGFGALYRGVSLTALRQGTNQAGMSKSLPFEEEKIGQSVYANMACVSSKLYSLLRTSRSPPSLPRNKRSPRLANQHNRSHLRSNGSLLQRPN